MTINKVKLTRLIFLGVFILVIILYFVLPKEKKNQIAPKNVVEELSQQVSEKVSEKLPVELVPKEKKEKIEISNLEVNNFYNTSLTTDDEGNQLITDKGKYAIFFIPKYNQFTISILDPSFEEVKKEAEEELVKILGADKKDLCFLNVSIGTPGFINPEEAGKMHKLSWCTQP
jgi:hypothetical protein